MDLAALIVLGMVAVATLVLHARTLSAHAVERERLTQLAVAKDGREYAQLRKASAEPAPPKEHEPADEYVQVGLG